MTISDVIEIHRETCNAAISTIRAKNEDYADNSDPFANFRASLVLGVDPKIGLLVRVVDKVQRLKNFAYRGELSVKDEPVDDAIEDIINYVILLKGMIKDEKNIDTNDTTRPGDFNWVRDKDETS